MLTISLAVLALASPGKFRAAMELSILGHHFRRVANSL